MNYIYDIGVFCGSCEEPTEININNGLCRECQPIERSKNNPYKPQFFIARTYPAKPVFYRAESGQFFTALYLSSFLPRSICVVFYRAESGEKFLLKAANLRRKVPIRPKDSAALLLPLATALIVCLNITERAGAYKKNHAVPNF